MSPADRCDEIIRLIDSVLDVESAADATAEERSEAPPVRPYGRLSPRSANPSKGLDACA
jgi:hypothetical protein